eukprot:6547312-Prymnesium_polylepis.1
MRNGSIGLVIALFSVAYFIAALPFVSRRDSKPLRPYPPRRRSCKACTPSRRAADSFEAPRAFSLPGSATSARVD